MKNLPEWLERLVDNTLGRVPASARHRMNTWQFWITAFGVFLGFIVAAIAAVAVITLRTQQRQLKERAVRLGNIQSQYITCVSNIDPAKNVHFLLVGLDELANAIVDNSQSTFDITKPGDFFYATRKKNLERVKAARHHILAFEPSSIPVANVKACKTARITDLKAYGVSPSDLPPPKVPSSVTTNQSRMGGNR